MGQSNEESPATDRAARAKLIMDAVEVAAESTDANPVVEVVAPDAHRGLTRSIPSTTEIRLERLPGGMLAAFARGQAYNGHLLDRADPQAGLALVDDIEGGIARANGDLAAAWQVRATASGVSPAGPVDEPWLEGPSSSAVLQRLKAVRAGRGGEVLVAIAEAPRWVARLSVGGRVGDLRVRGRLSDSLNRVDTPPDAKPRWHGSWRLQGEFPDASRMLEEITEAIRAQAPEAAEVGHPTIAVRLEQKASASNADEETLPEIYIAYFAAIFLSIALVIVLAPTTGFFALFHLEGEYSWLLGLIAVWLVPAFLMAPAFSADEVASRIADRSHIRWSAKLWIRRAALLGTYAAVFAVVSLLPYWAAVLAVIAGGLIGYELLKRPLKRRHH